MKYLTIFIGLFLAGCSSGNLEYVKEKAEHKWEKQGYKVLDYEGYEWGFWGLNNYGGAKVWYRLRRLDNLCLSYSGYLQRWGDELHVYGPLSNEDNLLLDNCK